MTRGPRPLVRAISSITATDSRAASSCRQRMTRSTPAINSRFAAAFLRSSEGMLTSSICGNFSSRSRICKPVVPASPSIKTLGISFPCNPGSHSDASGALVRCSMIQSQAAHCRRPDKSRRPPLGYPPSSSSRDNLMKIHEYQGKEILRNFGVPVPRGIPAFTVQEAVEAAQKLGGPVWVVKAQIHAGGRGKGGGVKLARSVEEVKSLAGQILGMQLVTHQTGPAGQKVRRLLIEDGADIKKEYYVSVVTDSASLQVAIMASSEGGMNIEEVTHATPEKIIKAFVDPLVGLSDAQAKKLADGIGVPSASTAQAIDVFKKLYKVYMETDASLVEINPLILEGNGNIKALDAKFNFDSNALYRHPEIVALRDLDEEDPAEIEASKYDLAYISLDGNIGCLVNGAGLAMATMDTIKLFGASPANFLDVGG